MNKMIAFLIALLLLPLATGALADSTISGLTPGGTVQTQDYTVVYRPSNPGTNFKVQFGSAAGVNIGTSGATVALLNGTNTYSAPQTFLSGDLTAADPVFTGGSLLLPVGTTGARPGSPINGMIRYNSTTPGVEAYVNGVWGPLAGSGGGITALTGDGTASGTGSVALTLATVNSTPGAYGDGQHVATYTVNGKGLVAVSGVATIAPPWSSITSTPTTRAGYGITDALSNASVIAAGGPIGSTSTVPVITYNAQGQLTAVTSATITPAAIGAAPNASPTFTGTVTLPASQVVNGVTLSSTGSSSLFLNQTGGYTSPSGGGSVSVTAASPDIVVTPSPGTGTFTIGTQQIINAQGTTTPYTLLSSDMGKTVTHNKSTAVAVTLPQAGTTGFATGTSFTDINIGSGVVTITPTTSTINGNGTVTLVQGQGAYFISDNANYYGVVGVGQGSTGQLAGYLTGPTGVGGLPNMTFSAGALTLGVNASVPGSVVLEGSSSGAVTVQPAASAGTWSLTLPTSGGTSGYVLSTNGSGVTSWIAASGTGTVTTVSVATANGVSGSVATATTTPAITVTLGAITPSTVTATGAINITPSALTISGSAVATNAALSNYFYVTLSHTATTTVSAPTNADDGQNLTYEFTQDGTGTNLVSWNAIFDFGASGAPTLSTAAAKVDIVGFKYSARLTKWVYLGSQLGN